MLIEGASIQTKDECLLVLALSFVRLGLAGFPYELDLLATCLPTPYSWILNQESCRAAISKSPRKLSLSTVLMCSETFKYCANLLIVFTTDSYLSEQEKVMSNSIIA
jgi:hypothetical protein